MSSSYDDYSRIHCKSILLSEAGVKFHLDTDDTKTITLKHHQQSVILTFNYQSAREHL